MPTPQGCDQHFRGAATNSSPAQRDQLSPDSCAQNATTKLGDLSVHEEAVQEKG